MADLLPSLTAFGISFTVIGIYWVSRHRMFRYVIAWDGRLLLLNLVFLFFIAVQPFTTSVLGEHGDPALATIVYALGMVGTGLSSTALWLHVVRAGPIDERLSPQTQALPHHSDSGRTDRVRRLHPGSVVQPYRRRGDLGGRPPPPLGALPPARRPPSPGRRRAPTTRLTYAVQRTGTNFRISLVVST